MAFNVVMRDDFSGGYRPDNWGQPFGGGSAHGGATWSPGDVGVSNGVLQVSMTRHADGGWTVGGLNSFKAGKVITYGTMEFDARVQEAQGTQAAILTWPQSDVWPRDGEIDILETPILDVMHTIHWQGSDGGDWYDPVRNQAYDPEQWHHYKLTWLPDLVRVEVDGVVRAEWTDPAQIPDVPHGLGAMMYLGTPSDLWMGGGPDGSTPSRVVTELDNVVLAQWDGQGGAGGGTTNPPPTAPPPPPVPPPANAPNPPPVQGGSSTVDWDALAAAITANFEATGQWSLPGAPLPTGPSGGPVDWDALAAQVVANFEATGGWYV